MFLVARTNESCTELQTIQNEERRSCLHRADCARVELFANPFLIEAPSYQRSFAWTPKEAGKLLDDISLALDEARSRRGRRLLPRHHAVHRPRRRAAALPPVLARAADRHARGHRRLSAADDAHHSPVRSARSRGGADRPANTGCWGDRHRAGATARPRLSLRETEDEFFLATCARPAPPACSRAAEGLSPSEERIVEVRDHFIAALGAHDAAERRRLADFLLDRCCVVLVTTTDIDRAHRMFTVLNAQGQAIGTQRNPQGAAARQPSAGQPLPAASPSGTRPNEPGDEFESLFSHIRAMYGRPDSQVISGVIEIAESHGAEASSRTCCSRSARIMDDIQHARHAGTAHSAAIVLYLRYLGWHTFADWKPAALAWWMKNGKDAEALERFLAKLDRLAFAVRILGIGGSKRARRFGAVIDAIESGHDVMGKDSPLQLTRAELRTIQHNLRDMHGRHASTAKQLLQRLTDTIAGKPQSLSLPENMTVEHVLPKKFGSKSEWRRWHPDPADRERCTTRSATSCS